MSLGDAQAKISECEASLKNMTTAMVEALEAEVNGSGEENNPLEQVQEDADRFRERFVVGYRVLLQKLVQKNKLS